MKAPRRAPNRDRARTAQRILICLAVVVVAAAECGASRAAKEVVVKRSAFASSSLQAFQPEGSAIQAPQTSSRRRLSYHSIRQGTLGRSATSDIAPSGDSAQALAYVDRRYREPLGLPDLTWDDLIAKAATAHTQYWEANGGPGSSMHQEQPGNPGFTGVWPWDRCQAAGSSANCGEVAFGQYQLPQAVVGWMNTPYHGLPFLQTNDFGCGESSDGSVCDMDYNTSSTAGETIDWSAPVNTSSAPVRIWPFNGATDVPQSWWGGEIPDPLTNYGGDHSNVGATMFVGVDESASVTLTTAAGAVIPLIAPDATTTVTPLPVSANESGGIGWTAFFPAQRLNPGASYTLTVSDSEGRSWQTTFTAAGKAPAKSTTPTTGKKSGTSGLVSPTKYNTTPSTPSCSVAMVSASDPVCGPWDVPKDPSIPEDYGQCTYWVAAKYPVLEKLADEYEPTDGRSWAFELAAQKAGYTIDHTPAVGDVAALAPTANDPTGHVAYVEQVNADGSFVISEMNAYYGLHGDINWLPASAATELYFIHGLPTSSSTGSGGSTVSHTSGGSTSRTVKHAVELVSVRLGPRLGSYQGWTAFKPFELSKIRLSYHSTRAGSFHLILVSTKNSSRPYAQRTITLKKSGAINLLAALHLKSLPAGGYQVVLYPGDDGSVSAKRWAGFVVTP